MQVLPAINCIGSGFAASGSRAAFGSQDSGYSSENGIEGPYSTPIADGGKYITRDMVNQLGYVGTAQRYLSQMGGTRTYEPSVADAIGGYPTDAVLYCTIGGVPHLVQSLIPNNKYNFNETPAYIDGVKWKLVSVKSAKIAVDYSRIVLEKKFEGDKDSFTYSGKNSTWTSGDIVVPEDCFLNQEGICVSAYWAYVYYWADGNQSSVRATTTAENGPMSSTTTITRGGKSIPFRSNMFVKLGDVVRITLVFRGNIDSYLPSNSLYRQTWTTGTRRGDVGGYGHGSQNFFHYVFRMFGIKQI